MLQLTDTAVKENRGLEHLNILYITVDSGIYAIARSCTKLKHLDPGKSMIGNSARSKIPVVETSVEN
jgi:hypothetical protein